MQDIEEFSTQFRGIEVSGVGVSTVKLDKAKATFQVIGEGKKAHEAFAKTGDVMQKVLMSLRQAGVKDEDMITAGLRCNPSMKAATKTKPSVIDGYTAVNNLTVRIKNLDKLGSIIDAASEAGGLIQFFTYETDTTSAEKTALKQAIEYCNEKAKVAADASGVELGQLLSVQQDVTRPHPMRFAAQAALNEASGASYGGIASGDMEVTVSLIAVYNIGKSKDTTASPR